MALSACVQGRPRMTARFRSASGLAPRRLDPRVSIAMLVAFNVQMTLTQDIFVEWCVSAIAVVAMAYCRRYASIVRGVACYAVLAFSAWALMASGSTVLAPFAASLLMLRHVLPVFMFAFNAIATTRLGELAHALQSLRVPSGVAVAICVAFRFLPTMGREFSAVGDAMKMRGSSASPKPIAFNPARTVERFFVPVIARLGVVADELGNAIVVRGAGSGATRTSYYRLQVHAIDVACAFAAAASFVFAVCLTAGAV